MPSHRGYPVRVAVKGHDALTSSFVRCQSCRYGGCKERALRGVANRLDRRIGGDIGEGCASDGLLERHRTRDCTRARAQGRTSRRPLPHRPGGVRDTFLPGRGAAQALWGGRGRRKLGAEPCRGCRTRDGRDRRLNQQRGYLRGPPCTGGIPVLDRKMTKLVSVLARDRP
jgi:hypothetical protein